jgi:hypothetical protein
LKTQRQPRIQYLPDAVGILSLVEQLVKVGIPIELVTTDDQAADLVPAKTDFGKTHTRGLLRAACKGPDRQSGGQSRLQKGSSTVHMIWTFEHL